MKEEILKMLREQDGYVSGEKICQMLGVSRTAVWKVINSLKEEGYEISSVSRKGYCLVSAPDAVTSEEIQSYRKSSYIGRKIVYFEETDSTNIQARLLSEGEDWDGTLVISEYQTLGKGRRGRNWSSPKGSGIWMSLLIKPDISPERVSGITLLTAVAVNRAVQKAGFNGLMIKWPNDLVAGGKKVCGILTEMSCQDDYINHVVIGIGINVNTGAFPEEIRNTAASLYEVTGKHIKRATVVADFLLEFEKLYDEFIKRQDLSHILDEYHKYLANKDEKVKVLKPGEEWEGTARGINERGELLVENDRGEIVTVISGEVSVRGIYGYV